MTAEPVGLTEARALLGIFEERMRRPEGVFHLAEALSFLADVRADAVSENIKLVVLNLTVAYARKVHREVESLLSSEPSVHWETVDHWQKVFVEFERSGFTLPQEVAETRSKLWMKKMDREIGLMSPSERKELLEKLQAMSI